MRTKLLILLSLVAIAAGSSLESVTATSPRFYPDDPIAREPEPEDAANAAPSEIGLLYELTYNSFALRGRKPTGIRAQNVNTIDEVPDSSWFTNRVGARALTIDTLVRGPSEGAPPDPTQWLIIRQKSAGGHVGITARDARGETWFLQFDPTYFPVGYTAAATMATKFFWAFGYNQVETFLTTFDPKRVEIDANATFPRPNGKRMRITRADLDQLLESAARNSDGTYRVVAGRLIPGKIIGRFRYEGTRPDDPNDLVAHEHRRELRALHVFASWTNMTDFKQNNTLDTLVNENGRMVVKHYLQDVGSTFGVTNDRYEWDLGWEHFVEIGTALKRIATFGFALSPWQTARFAQGPEIGNFEGDRFDPRKWKTHTPNPATIEMRDDDAFWAALRVAAFNSEMIRAIIHTGEFSDPRAEAALGDIMIKRRDKILRAYLPAVNPIIGARLTDTQLTFENAAVLFDVAKAPERYRAAWSRFDNATGETQPIAETSSITTALEAPAGLPAGANSMVLVEISAVSKEHPSWARPVRTYFRREPGAWKLVGLERMPETLTAGSAHVRASR